MCFLGMPLWALTVQCHARAEYSSDLEHTEFQKVLQDLGLLFLRHALQICAAMSVIQHMYGCVLEVWWQQNSTNLRLPSICSSYSHDLGTPDLAVFRKPWKWHLIGLNMTDRSALFSLLLGSYFTLRNLIWVTTLQIHEIYYYFATPWWRLRRTRGSFSTFPSLAAKKSRSQSKAQESESHLGGWTHSSSPCVPGGRAVWMSSPDLQRSARGSLALTSLSFCWDEPSWPAVALPSPEPSPTAWDTLCVLWLLRTGYPDGTAEGSTWLPPRRGIRSPSWSGAGTRHSQPGGRQLQAWWCDPQGIIPPATHLQPSKPRCGVGHGSCMKGVGQVKRVRREALGVS